MLPQILSVLAIIISAVKVAEIGRRDVAECPCGFSVQEEIASEFMLNLTCSNLAKYRSCYDENKGGCGDLAIDAGLESIKYVCSNSDIKSKYLTLTDCVRPKTENIVAKQRSCTLQTLTCDKLEEYINCMIKPVDDCCGDADCTTSYDIIHASIQPFLDNGNLDCNFQHLEVCTSGSQGTCA